MNTLFMALVMYQIIILLLVLFVYNQNCVAESSMWLRVPWNIEMVNIGVGFTIVSGGTYTIV